MFRTDRKVRDALIDVLPLETPDLFTPRLDCYIVAALKCPRWGLLIVQNFSYS